MSRVLTFGDMKEKAAYAVGSGRCASDPEVAKAINDAVELLINEGDWANTVHRMCFKVRAGCIALPEGVDTILKHTWCGSPANTWTYAYEFLGAGPGDIEMPSDPQTGDLVDRGWHPTQFPLEPYAMRVAALSTAAEDVGMTLSVSYPGATGNATSEGILIGRWLEGAEGTFDHDDTVNRLSTETLSMVSEVRKPVTTGHVILFGYDPETHQVGFLGKYKPRETQPRFRRYAITGFSYAPASFSQQRSYITALVKLGYVPLEYDDQVLPIQHAYAIQTMVAALYEKRRGNYDKGMAMHADAVRMLQKQLGNQVRNRMELDVDFSGSGYSWGSSLNVM